MASEADKKKAQTLVDEAERLYKEAKTKQEIKAWAEDTLSKMDEIIKIAPNSADAWSNRGVARSNLGDHLGAVNDCTMSIELNPKDASLWNNLGGVRKESGNYQGAIDAYNKAIELKPKHAPAWNNRGAAKNERGDHQGAIDDCTKAIEFDPNYAPGWNNRGVAKNESGDHQGALDDFTKAIKLDPKNASLWNNQGLAKNELGDHQGALDDFTKAIKLDPDFAIALHSRGVTRYRLSRYDDALEDLDEALRLDPNDEVLQRNREAVLLAIESEKRKDDTFEKEREHHKRLKAKAQYFRKKHNKNIKARDRLFCIILLIICGYFSALLLLFMLCSDDTNKCYLINLFDNPFGLLPYLALLFTILSPLIWRISINIKEAEKNLILAEDYNGRYTVELYLQRFFSEERDRREFAQKYMVYWMYNNPSETLIRLANKSTNQPELPQVEQIHNIIKNTPTDQ